MKDKSVEKDDLVLNLFFEDDYINSLDDREFIQLTIEGKVSLYDQSVIDRLAKLDAIYPAPGEISEMIKQAKTVMKDWFIAEFNRKISEIPDNLSSRS